LPRYDYRCEAGHKYEKQEPFGSPAHQPCQRCGKPAHRVLNAPTMVFKSGGFYKTESRGSVPSDKPSSSETSGESKPAEKQKSGDDSGSKKKSKAAAAD
jgi:putative FmdB family regulatory protein